MARGISFFQAFILLCTSSLVAALEPVSISAKIKDIGHTCVSKCIYYTVLSDVGEALNCGTPYDNNCYCATAAQSFSAAEEHFDRCASSLCKAGDLKQDLTSMHSIYASYCMGAGYTQPGATAWFNPAEVTEEPESSAPAETGSNKDAKPSQTPKDNSPATSTQLTIVTQTTEGDNGASRSQVIVQATSTLYLNPDGSPAKLGSSSSSSDNGWKIGVGVAIPVVAILGGALAWWFLRRKRRNQFVSTNQPPEYVPPVETVQTTPPPPTHQESISRKPVASPAVASVSPVSPVTKTTELSGDGVSRELSGRDVQPLVTPSPPVALPGQHEMQGEGQHRPEMQGDQQYRPEMQGDGQFRTEVDGQGRVAEMTGVSRPPELDGQSQSPPPQYTGYSAPAPEQRWELPDNSR